MKCFKSLFITLSIFLLTSIAGTAHAIVEGVIGEAQLVPFVLHDDGEDFHINTRVRIILPSEIPSNAFADENTIPNIPRDTDGPIIQKDNMRQICEKSEFGGGSRPVPCDTIHWYLYDTKSVKVMDGSFVLTEDDMYVWDFDLVASSQFRNQPMYLVFATEQAAEGNRGANVAFFAEASMEFSDNADDLVPNKVFAHIPALAMSDGPDVNETTRLVFRCERRFFGGPRWFRFPRLRCRFDPETIIVTHTFPVPGNEVIYTGGVQGFPINVAPLATGMPANNGDGDGTDRLRFSQTLGVRATTGNLLVLWSSENSQENASVIYNVLDANEDECSGLIRLSSELNVIFVEPVELEINEFGQGFPFQTIIAKAWHLGEMFSHANGAERSADDTSSNVCVPPGLSDLAAGGQPALQPGFMTVRLNEIGDRAGGQPSAAIVPFSITFPRDAWTYIDNNSQDPYPGGAFFAPGIFGNWARYNPGKNLGIGDF